MKQIEVRGRGRNAAVTLEWMSDEEAGEWQQALVAATIAPAPVAPAPVASAAITPAGATSAIAAGVAPVARAKRKWWLQLAVEWGALLVIVVGAAGWQWYATRGHWQAVEAELTTAVSSARWVKTARVELLELKGDEALVRVFVQPQPSEDTFRQTRVYKKTAAGWELVEPRAAFWGKPLQLETRYFTFIYRARDTEVVTEAARKIDALYPRLFGSFFAEEATGGKRTIEVEVSPGSTPLSTAGGQGQKRLVVASPATTVAPARISEAELLFHSVALALLNDLAAEAVQRYAYPPFTNSFAGPLYLQQLTDSLRLWQLAELDLPAGIWYGVASANYDSSVLASSLEICALHQAKSAVAGRVGAQAAPDPSVACPGAWLYAFAPHLRLAQTVTFVSVETTPGLSGAAGQVGELPNPAAPVVLATVLDYAAARYGQACLPLLLANFGSHRTWETLIPVVFGVSAAEFEQGWQAYLAAHYVFGPMHRSR